MRHMFGFWLGWALMSPTAACLGRVGPKEAGGLAGYQQEGLVVWHLACQIALSRKERLGSHLATYS